MYWYSNKPEKYTIHLIITLHEEFKMHYYYDNCKKKLEGHVTLVIN